MGQYAQVKGFPNHTPIHNKERNREFDRKKNVDKKKS